MITGSPPSEGVGGRFDSLGVVSFKFIEVSDKLAGHLHGFLADPRAFLVHIVALQTVGG